MLTLVGFNSILLNLHIRRKSGHHAGRRRHGAACIALPNEEDGNGGEDDDKRDERQRERGEPCGRLYIYRRSRLIEAVLAIKVILRGSLLLSLRGKRIHQRIDLGWG